MRNLVGSGPAGKPHLAARPAVPALPWRLVNRSLRTLAPHERATLGRSLDVGDLRLLLGENGDVFAVRRRLGV
jgi:hypothetical protein